MKNKFVFIKAPTELYVMRVDADENPLDKEFFLPGNTSFFYVPTDINGFYEEFDHQKMSTNRLLSLPSIVPDMKVPLRIK